jgi:hypothetical protein
MYLRVYKCYYATFIRAGVFRVKKFEPRKARKLRRVGVKRFKYKGSFLSFMFGLRLLDKKERLDDRLGGPVVVRFDSIDQLYAQAAEVSRMCGGHSRRVHRELMEYLRTGVRQAHPGENYPHQ